MSAVDGIKTGTYSGPLTLPLGIDLPAGIELSIEQPIEDRFRDSVFYDNGPIAVVTVNGTTIEFEATIDGETRATLNHPSGIEEHLRHADDFRRAFPNGDTDMPSGDSDSLWWDLNSWYDLYQAPPLREQAHRGMDHLDEVHHDIADIIKAAIEQAVAWLPWAIFFTEGANPTREQFVDAAMNAPEDTVLFWISQLPEYPEEAKVAVALRHR